MPELKELASCLIQRPPTRKAEIVALIAAHMTGESLKTIWQKLPKPEQQAVAEAIYTPASRFNWRLIRAKYHSGNKFDRSILFRLFSPDGKYVARDLAEELRSFVPEPREDRLTTLDHLPDDLPDDIQTGSGDGTAILELHAVLQLVQSNLLKVSSKTLRPTAATVRKVNDILVGGDFYPPEWTPDKYTKPIGPMRAFAWPLLLQAGGLAHQAGGRLTFSSKGKKALRRQPSEVLRTLYRGWVKSDLFDEFERIDQVKGQKSRGGRHMTPPAERRAMIAQTLESLRPDTGVSVEEFGRFIQGADLDFKVTRDPWQLYVGDAQYGLLGYGGVPLTRSGR